MGLCFVGTVSAQYHVELRTVDDGLPQRSVNAILQTRDGYVWLATNGGLARFDGMRFVTFDVGNTPGMTSNRILSLCEIRSAPGKGTTVAVTVPLKEPPDEE